MDCRTFRRKHLAFVDDTIPGVDAVQMERHRRECARCARLDSDIRRSLVLIRNNLETIQPSAHFSDRLSRRLITERSRSLIAAPLFRGPGLGGFLSMSLGVVALGVIAVALSSESARPSAARLPAVVVRPKGALLGVNSALPVAPPAFVASVATGMAVWPALLMMEEAQSRYAKGRERAPVRAVNYSSPTR